jgi:hypothetical protein
VFKFSAITVFTFCFFPYYGCQVTLVIILPYFNFIVFPKSIGITFMFGVKDPCNSLAFYVWFNRLLPLMKHPDHLWGLPSLLYNEWVKQPGCKADHLPPSAEVKSEWQETSVPPHVFLELRQTYLIFQLVMCSSHFHHHS